MSHQVFIQRGGGGTGISHPTQKYYEVAISLHPPPPPGKCAFMQFTVYTIQKSSPPSPAINPLVMTMTQLTLDCAYPTFSSSIIIIILITVYSLYSPHFPPLLSPPLPSPLPYPLSSLLLLSPSPASLLGPDRSLWQLEYINLTGCTMITDVAMQRLSKAIASHPSPHHTYHPSPPHASHSVTSQPPRTLSMHTSPAATRAVLRDGGGVGGGGEGRRGVEGGDGWRGRMVEPQLVFLILSGCKLITDNGLRCVCVCVWVWVYRSIPHKRPSRGEGWALTK